MVVALAVVHTTVAALWLGAMAYSLSVVQPRLARMVGEGRVEAAQQQLAHGNRWPVVAMIALLWSTGAGLALLGGGDGWWWLGVAAKAALLAAATALFWWVSWRGWPRRVFALPAELPGIQRRFRRVALAMFVLVGAAFVAGSLL